MQMVTLQVPTELARKILDLPESDGKPMGETEYHIRAILELFQLLDVHFRDDENVYVGADMLYYYNADSPTEYIVPDVFVVKGVKKELRRTYRIWDEHVVPSVVLEITSKSTQLEDLGKKRLLYELLGVREYFVFDPRSEYLKPQLQGFELHETEYDPLPARVDGTLYSRELDLFLKPTPHFIRPIDPKTGQPVPTYTDLEDRAEAEAERAQAEAERAQAEAERAQAEAERAQAEAERAQAEAERAQAEAERALRAETENERLRAELEQLRRQTKE